MTTESPPTDEQRAIVEWGDGPLVVIAGAGTGKTRVIVERVRRLLETKGDATADSSGGLRAREPVAAEDPFAGPLVPEQILVLTYNVKATTELRMRFERSLGVATAARLAVANFHGFCNGILVESAAEADLPARPDVLDGVGQVLLLRDIRPGLSLVYHGGTNDYWLGPMVAFINRAKDELVTPGDFDRFVEVERAAFERRYGSYEAAVERLRALGSLDPLRDVRKSYARLRRDERAGVATPADDIAKAADREARRTVAGDGHVRNRNGFGPADLARIDELAASYVVDGAALEVLRLMELALVYHAYQEELATRGALDFGEQIAAATELFKRRPNVLRRYQRQYRYVLVDEFQDANIAQIELIELLGRTPDRPDNVMVVGDDDQSIYRFRGASFAAFVEFDRRFSGPPAHDPGGPAPGDPPRRRLTRNFRSVGNVLVVANRLISRNELRYERDKALYTTDRAGDPVAVVSAAGPIDEADAIVDRIVELARWDPSAGREPDIPWSEIAVLYRKHRHREEIVARLRAENIPYTVSGGLSLFETPEIRDLEMSLRAIADPLADVAVGRMMTAGPWRLDALEMLRVTRMAKPRGRPLVEAIREVVESGEVEIDVEVKADVAAEDDAGEVEVEDDVAGAGAGLAGRSSAATPNPPTTSERPRAAVEPETRAKLRRLLGILDDLGALTWREGPYTILDALLERTGQVLDLIAADTLEAKRTAANVASLLRFAHDWQAEHPLGTLAGFVDYLDAYQSAGGELPTSVELSEDVGGVRLMTLYQAKGLEYRYVFVPYLITDEWPAREYGAGLFPPDLLREAIPGGDIHTEEERRLLYVAITRAREGLMLLTHPGATGDRRPSLFVGELTDGARDEVRTVDRTRGAGVRAADGTGATNAFGAGAGDEGRGGSGEAAAALDQVIAAPLSRERRLALRLRAAELIGLLEGIDGRDPEADDARRALGDQLHAVGEATSAGADEARARGLDPLTLRVLAFDGVAGANLLDVAPLPPKFSYSQFAMYERCPLQYAFRHVYRFPEAQGTGATTFGSTAHAAFERFTRERRERLARGEAPPTREDLEAYVAAEWKPTAYKDRTTEDAYRHRVATLLDNFWAGELATAGDALHEELEFDLALEPDDGSPAVVVHGSIDRVDRLPEGGLEVIDYKTGRISSQKGVDESLQLSIYALACRDALGLGTPEHVTLYFTESATRLSTVRTDAQLDEARADVLARAALIRSGDFAAQPSQKTCAWCDYASMCPSRVR